ncbi:MAG: hypothetical protein K2U26_08125 [Cyclobacteriaceae bacterium]|nr:hypothetical protein [Cyclobacteriaceae bacterium]
MFKNFLKKEESPSKEEIGEYLNSGKYLKTIFKDPRLMNGLITLVRSIHNYGFNYTTITEISVIGQLAKGDLDIDVMKNELTSGKFRNSRYPARFDVNDDYVNLFQITIDYDKSFAVAEAAPADYFRTQVGIKWIVPLPKRIDVDKIPNTFLEFLK